MKATVKKFFEISAKKGDFSVSFDNTTIRDADYVYIHNKKSGEVSNTRVGIADIPDVVDMLLSVSKAVREEKTDD